MLATRSTVSRRSKWDRSTKWKIKDQEVNRYKRKWTGQDLADFISLSVYTGLRISDVATFHASRMQASGEILLRTTKAGTHVFTWVPEWLQERIKVSHDAGLDLGWKQFTKQPHTDMATTRTKPTARYFASGIVPPNGSRWNGFVDPPPR